MAKLPIVHTLLKVYTIIVRQRETSYERREEMDNMSNKEVVRLIEWLKNKGFSSDDIVECLEYISK